MEDSEACFAPAIDAARDRIAPGYDWFTEGFHAPDLKEVKVLLDELS